MPLLILGCLLAAAVIIVLAGPRVKTDISLRPLSVPDDTEAYLAAMEKKVDRLIPGTEKTVVWAGTKGAPTEYAVIYFHGFTTSRQEITPVAETIARRIGANVFFTRLAGHGLDDVNALGRPTVNDWINDAWEAYHVAQKIGEKIICISVSMGGLPALWLALNHPGISANIMISPLFWPARPATGVLLFPWGKVLARLLVGAYRKVEIPFTDSRYEKLASLVYPSQALVTMMGMCRLGSRFPMERLTVPTLCLYTDQDDVISLPRMKKALGRAGHGVVIMRAVPAKHHCLTGNPLSPETNEKVIRTTVDFLSGKLGLPPS